MIQSAVIFGCEGPTLLPREVAFFREVNPWGFILFARNLETPDQIKALTSDLRATVGWDIPILIDQEGGRVARLRAPLATEWPAPKDHFGTLPDMTAEEVAWLRYRIIAAELKALGIDVNCAPMLDLMQPDTHDIIADRAYGSDPDRIAKLGRAVAQGLLDGGVLPIMKHIPGHGRATIDSHHDLPRVSAPKETLLATDFAPFKPLADLPMAMTGHVVFEDIDPDNCATLSPTVISIIRQGLGVDGLLMTDDLSMKALSGSFADRSSAALSAGCDVLLHCNGVMEEMTEVASVAPLLSGKSLERADTALAHRREASVFDVEGAGARINDLINSVNAGES